MASCKERIETHRLAAAQQKGASDGYRSKPFAALVDTDARLAPGILSGVVRNGVGIDYDLKDAVEAGQFENSQHRMPGISQPQHSLA
jgi:hypothetical protein